MQWQKDWDLLQNGGVESEEWVGLEIEQDCQELKAVEAGWVMVHGGSWDSSTLHILEILHSKSLKKKRFDCYIHYGKWFGSIIKS